MKSGDSLNLVAHQTWERMAQKTEKSVGSSDLNRGSQTLLPNVINWGFKTYGYLAHTLKYSGLIV